MTAPEFSRPVAIDTIGEIAQALKIDAGAAERVALARRFGVPTIDRISADLRVVRRGGVPYAEGMVTADVVQACVVTGDPLPVHVEEPLAIRFLAQVEEAGDEIELSADACDTSFYQGTAIDLGEAAAETMALALDPFPRAPHADAALKAAGVLGEDPTGPFSALAALKDKLS